MCLEVVRIHRRGLGSGGIAEEIVGHHERDRDGEFESAVLETAHAGDLEGAMGVEARKKGEQTEGKTESTERRQAEKKGGNHGGAEEVPEAGTRIGITG